MRSRGRRGHGRSSRGAGFPSMYGAGGNAIASLMGVITFVFGMVMLVVIFGPKENQTEAIVPAKTRLTDFVLSNLCAATPTFLTGGTSELGTTKLTAAANTYGQFKGILENSEREVAVLELEWDLDSDYLVVKVSDNEGNVWDTRESAQLDPGGFTIMLGFNNSDEVVIVRVPFDHAPLWYVVSHRTDVVDYRNACPK